MKKYVTYDEEEMLRNLNSIYRSLDNLAKYLALVSQQLDYKRSNLTSKYLKESVSTELSNITSILNNFNLESEKKETPSIEKKIKELEEKMKQDID
ncbi:MAG TPA: hypothetical protein PLT60_02045 [Candidatus Pacearchaeota archaeon]|jgi:hypothetical protein|nr:hypothetical protein [Candidatus Pacearchaeota archaeon]HOF44319.1 hypothetical protein [Candidatus Pacearchaeota archaeon]HOR52646.1 hypothetical protein [Candidatus Pacearchaeota archaeon]HPJ86717.1 hypothetical protein [Candidatus Pacearchaeota archaeon]HPX74630.1 hypothetical protein [Candidatus Pacearchaeota archaeon]